jgi:PTS system galactitol-specific IIB component
MGRKRILVVCGTGIATSTVIATKVREHCAQQGVEVDVDQTKVMETLGGAEGYDLVISTTQLPAAVTTPSVNGLSFLTGVGVEDTLRQIVEKLRG